MMIYALQVELTKDTLKFLQKEASKKNVAFSDKKYLDSLFLPAGIIGRRNEALQLIEYFESMKKGLMVPAISIYGRSGSGKSTLVRFLCDNMYHNMEYCFVNLRRARTLFGCANMILGELGCESLVSADGLDKAVEKVGNTIRSILDNTQKKFFILVLDEYDIIFSDKRGNPSDFIYKLLTLEESLREQDLWLCIITISNNALMEYNLDDRVKSRIGNSEVFFEPYTASDIFSIIRSRSEKAFCRMPDDSVLEKCAELAADGHGDARRAIDLLRVAGEISNGRKITEKDIIKADQSLQVDRLKTVIGSASYHQGTIVRTICEILLENESNTTITSAIYQRYCDKLGEKSLSYRRVVDLLTELVNSGLLHARNISRGRKGYGTEYTLVIPLELVGLAIGKDWWYDQLESKELMDSVNASIGRRTKQGSLLAEMMKTSRLIKKYDTMEDLADS
ncbi:ORC1-type DNA replication protein 1 [Marine Group I thaumarchaeote SCGC AAA799-B03]|uniref:ORC1-type DNA replication protein n=1 Tax=Marine Group I thaumarchaeote SCGC AAA799-B03 TaxID=1502289 RepID=A0A087S8V1_9ARCH|nr:ORC1-type DNA replication protein 1 [Marine Group I thaumarchaeote SCGC AAA799-B03]